MVGLSSTISKHLYSSGTHSNGTKVLTLVMWTHKKKIMHDSKRLNGPEKKREAFVVKNGGIGNEWEDNFI